MKRREKIRKMEKIKDFEKEGNGFDYDAAVKRVEEIISIIESADFRISSSAALLKEAAELIGRCRAYLREAKDSCGLDG